MASAAAVSKLSHPRLGQCELVRIEGTDWIVKVTSSGVRYRVPPEKRSEFKLVVEVVSVTSNAPARPVAAGVAQPPPPPPEVATTQWYYSTDSKTREGPVCFTDLQQLTKAGRLAQTDMVQQVGHRVWRPAREIPELFGQEIATCQTTSQWYYSTDSKTREGPVCFTDLQQLTKAGRLAQTDMVQQVGHRVWRPAREIPELFSEPLAPPPPPESSRQASEGHSEDGRRVSSPGSLSARDARRVIDSLRVGLPSLDGSTRCLAVGFQETADLISGFLKDADAGGSAMTLQGAYGQGKTFALTILEETAREAGFMTVRTEIDASENQLNKPHHIYRDLMRNLRLPEANAAGVRCLAQRVYQLLQGQGLRSCSQRRRWLEEQLGCFPLSWLLSDPDFLNKPALIGLLECDPNYPVNHARNHHVLRTTPRDWPAFSAATQGDFASFVLSGLGRLARLLGCKGLVVIMDEMEKWYELNWAEQSRAGNLLGGLIWGATAQEGRRGWDDHPSLITHSGRCGGYPFTTDRRCHVGVAIAMTPRDEDVSSNIWSYYGLIEVCPVPPLTEDSLSDYCRLVLPVFARAYGLSVPPQAEQALIAAEAVSLWQNRGDFNTRSGVQAAITALDNWRERT